MASTTSPVAPTLAELAWWRATIERLGALSDEDVAALAGSVRVRALIAGEAYLRGGDPAAQVALIREGTLRESYALADGRERIRAFGTPGDFAGSLSDLLRGGPARCEVIACSPARLLTVPWAEVRRVAAARPAWRAVLAAVTELLYLAKAEREYELLALDAMERYQRFRSRMAAVEETVAQRHIASYLGITPEHLSRLRRRLGLRRPRGQIAAAASRSPRQSPRRSRASGRR